MEQDQVSGGVSVICWLANKIQERMNISNMRISKASFLVSNLSSCESLIIDVVSAQLHI